MLQAPEQTYVPEKLPRRRSPGAGPRRLRRDFAEDLSDPSADEQEGGYRRRKRTGVTGLRLTFHGGLPQTLWGRLAFAVAILACLGVAAAGAAVVRDYILHDPHFVLRNWGAISIEGMDHLSRSELLSVFSDDVDRNLLRVPLAERRAELERLPWVERATVMRLLPDHLRVAVTERTPVAFVRHGARIGLVDANGVLLDLPGGPEHSSHPATVYSFPVVTGIEARDPLSVRAARMKIFTEFTTDLDSAGGMISGKLSEVDLSNPEDIKALIPEKGDILVHFGDRDYLDRYRKFEEHLPEWRAQYPRLASVDMRYERQVVLEMQNGAPVPVPGAEEPSAPAARPHAAAAKPPVRTAAKPHVAIAPKKPASRPADGRYHPRTGTRP